MNHLLALLSPFVNGLRIKTALQPSLTRGCFWSVIILFSSFQAHTQESGTSLSLQFTNAQKQALPDVSVSLFSKTDSSLVKVEIADSIGVTLFEALQPGSYFFTATTFGYTTYISDSFTISIDQPTIAFPLISLMEEKVLDEASVVYKSSSLNVTSTKLC